MGFTTVPDALRAAAQAGQDAVAELRNADCGTPVQGVAGALPGARAASAAASFAHSWASSFTNWCGRSDEHASALAKAADAYVAADDHASSSIPASGTLRGPL